MTEKTKRNRTEVNQTEKRKSQKGRRNEAVEEKDGGDGGISKGCQVQGNDFRNEGAKKNGGIQCEVCGKRIRSSYYMRFHMAVHTGEKNYVCGICEKGYQQKWNLITHVGRVHSKEKPFRCHDCGKSFGYSSHFKRHVKTHFLDRIEAPETVKRRILNPHGCDSCGKSFESNYRLRLHLRTHTGNRPFVCDQCGKSFTTRRLCSLHAKKVHEKKEGEFICEHCGRIFSHRSSIVLHLKTEHHAGTKGTVEGESDSRKTSGDYVFRESATTEKEMTTCEVCGKIVTRGSVKKHLNIHYRNRIYSCRYCRKEFLESGQRMVHERRHTGEKPYLCDVCGKGHAQYSNLLTHRKRYHNLTSKTPDLWKQKTSVREVENDRKLAGNQIGAKTFEMDNLNNVHDQNGGDSTSNKSSEICAKQKCTGDETLEEFLKIASRWVNKKFQESKNKNAVTATVNGENVSAVRFENQARNEKKAAAIADESTIDKEEEESQFHEENVSDPMERESEKSKSERNESSRAKTIKFRISQIIFDRIVADLMETDARSKVSSVLDVIRNGKTQRKSGDDFKRFLRLMKTIPDNSVTRTDGEGNFVSWHCWMCPSKSKSRHLLARHLLVHEPEENRPYECKICSKSFTQSNNHKEHVMSHLNRNQFCCDKCGTGFRHKSHFDVHMRRHDPSVSTRPSPSPSKRHACSFCGKKHSTNHQRLEHERTHTKERPFLCKICGRQFAASSTLSRHQSTHGPSPPSHQCSLCLKFFRQKSSLKRHLGGHSENPDRSRFGCDCGKTFTQSPSLKKHKMICKNRLRPAVKPFPCPVCTKRFLTGSDLKRHVATHDAAKKFECSICFLHLKTAETLKRHLRRHDDETTPGKNMEKNFRCEKCDSTFLDLDEMQKHTVENHLK